MSTAPNVTPLQTAQAIINEAFRDLCDRIKTGKLKATAKNGSLLLGRVRETNQQMKVLATAGQLPTAKQLADAFYTAVRNVEFARLLDWEVLPTALRGNTSAPTKVGDTRETSTFEGRVRASEKSDAERNAQEQAKKRCQTLVEQFAPTDHRRGTLKFDLRDSKQKEWTEQISKTKDFVKLEREIRNDLSAIYTKLEKQAERV